MTLMTRRVHTTIRAVVFGALLLAMGSFAGRALGLGRTAVIALAFGRQPGVDAYAAAWAVPNVVYDVLISGVASAAIVPVLSEYAEGDQREFWRIVGALFNLAFAGLALGLGLLAWQTPLAVRLLVRSSQPALFDQTVLLVRQLLPAVLCMGLAGVVMAVLYARQVFVLPAFAVAALNAGMIVGVVALRDQLGIASITAGALIGAVGQLALQAPGLRGFRPVPTLGLRHPAVRRILRLSAPVGLGVLFFLIGTLLDRWLASGFPAALATMQYATTLVQFPLGLVAAAVSLAALPTLARQHAAADEPAFARTLAAGLKIVVLLVVPACAGLAALAGPITTLLFQRGAFAASDTAATTAALLGYLPGLPAIAVAQVLLFACYARQNTLLPNLVQGLVIGIYLAVALPLLRWTQPGFLALVLANTAQWIGHMLLLFVLVARSVRLRGLRIREALVKALVAGLVMAGTAALLASLLAAAGPLVQVTVAGGVATLLYLGLSAALRVEALGILFVALRRRFGADGR